MRMNRLILSGLFAGSLPLVAQEPKPGAMQEAKGLGVVVLRAARLIDGTGSPAVLHGVVVVTAMRNATKIAMAHHVQIALGTDAGVDPHGQIYKQLTSARAATAAAQ